MKRVYGSAKGDSCDVDSFCDVTYLAKLLNAADCGFMQSGTRDVFSCSAINLCISSETDNDVPACKWMTEAKDADGAKYFPVVEITTS